MPLAIWSIGWRWLSRRCVCQSRSASGQGQRCGFLSRKPCRAARFFLTLGKLRPVTTRSACWKKPYPRCLDIAGQNCSRPHHAARLTYEKNPSGRFFHAFQSGFRSCLIDSRFPRFHRELTFPAGNQFWNTFHVAFSQAVVLFFYCSALSALAYPLRWPSRNHQAMITARPKSKPWRAAPKPDAEKTRIFRKPIKKPP